VIRTYIIVSTSQLSGSVSMAAHDVASCCYCCCCCCCCGCIPGKIQFVSSLLLLLQCIQGINGAVLGFDHNYYRRKTRYIRTSLNLSTVQVHKQHLLILPKGSACPRSKFKIWDRYVVMAHIMRNLTQKIRQ
jgi:hypothetical protein